MSGAGNICNKTKVCAVRKAETNLHPMEALSISRKLLKTRDILDRAHFRQRPPRRSPRASSAPQLLDLRPKPPECTLLSHFCAIKYRIDAQVHTIELDLVQVNLRDKVCAYHLLGRSKKLPAILETLAVCPQIEDRAFRSLFTRGPRVEVTENALALCAARIQAFKRKADHNKREALWCFLAVIGATLLIPLFVTLGPGLVIGKVIPSVLSLIAAGATAWLQLRKPQQLWSMYRTAQREFEDHETKFKFQIGVYENSQDPDKELAAAVAEISLGIHYQWVHIVPNPAQLKAAKDAPALQQLTVMGSRNEH